MPLPLLVPAVAACCGGYLASLHESEEITEPPSVDSNLSNMSEYGDKVDSSHYASSLAYYKSKMLGSEGFKTEFHRISSRDANQSSPSKRRFSSTIHSFQSSPSSPLTAEARRNGREPVVTIPYNASGLEITEPVVSMKDIEYGPTSPPLKGSKVQQLGYAEGKFIEGKMFDMTPNAETWVICFSPDSSLLAIGLQDEEGIAIYETEFFSLLKTIESTGTISTLQWRCYENKVLLSAGSLDGTIQVLDIVRLRSESLLSKNNDTSKPTLYSKKLCRVKLESSIRSMSFIPGYAAGLALSIGETSGQVSVLSNLDPVPVRTISNSPILRRIDFHSDAVLSLAISLDGRLIASGCSNGSIRILNVELQDTKKEELSALHLQPEKEMHVLRRSITPQEPHTAQMLKQDVGVRHLVSNLHVLKREGAIRSMVFSRDSRVLFAGGFDKSVYMIDATVGQVVREMKHDGIINSMQFDDSYRFLAVGSRDKSLTVYDTSTFHPIKTIETGGWVTSISWGSGDYENILAVRGGSQLVTLINFQPIQLAKTNIETSSEEGSSVSWSFDGKFLARITGSSIVVTSSAHAFGDVAEATRTENIRSVRFCMLEDKQHLLSVVGDDGKVAVYQLCRSMGKFYLELLDELFLEEGLRVVAWSEDGALLAAGGWGRKIHLISVPDCRHRCPPIDIEGRALSIDFIRQRCIDDFGNKLSSVSMAVGTGANLAILFDVNRCEITLHIARPQIVWCVRYHPTLPLLAIGDNNRVILIDLIAEQVVKEFTVEYRVNCFDFSPCGRYVALADDYCFTIRETMTFKILQSIPSRGWPQSVVFERSGRFLVLDNHKQDAMILQLGPLLGIEFMPISDDDEVPLWAWKEVIYRSSDSSPSLLQRYMNDGSQRSTIKAADILSSFPETVYTFDRRTGEDCFATALKLGKPALLVLVMTTLVNGSLENENGKKSFLTTAVPDKGFATLSEMISYLPSKFIVEIMNKIAFVKVPFAGARVCKFVEVNECAHTTFTSPWGEPSPYSPLVEGGDPKLGWSIDHKTECIRTPAVLPLPGLGSYAFLSALTTECSPPVFDNDAMGLVLSIMWRKHIRHYFLIDILIFAVFFILWIVFVDLTSSSTSSSVGGRHSLTVAMGAALLVLNTLFAAKELVQSNYGRKTNHFVQSWNLADLMCIVFVYTTCILTIKRGAGNGSVPWAVVGTLSLTIKLLSYLRGFHDTGWLLSVLQRNFYDVRGFVVVLMVIMVGFTVSFRLLFGNVEGECILILDGEEIAEDCDPAPYGNIFRALLSTFELSILGAYDPGIFGASQFGVLSSILFILAVTVILVVALNALIALLSDSYSRVQESATANQRMVRAELIVEYMSLLPKRKLRKIESSTRYFHALLEADAEGDLLVNKNDWQGGLNALRRDIHDLNDAANEEMVALVNGMKGDLNDEISRLRSELFSALQGLSAEVRDVRRMQHVYARGIVGGKQVTTAVNAVKTMGGNLGSMIPINANGIPTLNFAMVQGGNGIPTLNFGTIQGPEKKVNMDEAESDIFHEL